MRVALLMMSLAVCFAASAAPPVNASLIGNVAIGGKDTLSYHAGDARTTRTVAEGDKRFEVEYLGATWRFASKASAERFAANPATYVPQYNGFCANALASDEGLIKTDGQVWEFFGDKLYLFYAERGRQRWLGGDWQLYRTRADAAWQAQLKK